MITDTAMRGIRIGGNSYERDDHNVEPVETVVVRYQCPKGHGSLVPFFAEAEEIPLEFSCRCGMTAKATHHVENMAAPDLREARYVRSHWDMLLERRTIADLEALLAERVAELHGNEELQKIA